MISEDNLIRFEECWRKGILDDWKSETRKDPFDRGFKVGALMILDELKKFAKSHSEVKE